MIIHIATTFAIIVMIQYNTTISIITIVAPLLLISYLLLLLSYDHYNTTK